MKIGLTGAKGMLGSDLIKLAHERGFETLAYDLPEHDISKSDVIDRIVRESDIIVNCAAYTAVDKAESEVHKAYSINALSVEKLGRAAAEAGRYMVHISTDFVFGDSTSEPQKESDVAAPLGVYGASKLRGENLLKMVSPESAVMRVQWTYGFNGDNFIKKIIKAARNNPFLKVVTDQIGAPTSTEAVSKAILALINAKAKGLYHFASKGYVSRFDVAAFILSELKLQKELIPCLSSEFVMPAQRPLNSKFDCSKIDSILGFERAFWEDELCEFLRKMDSVTESK